MGLRQGSSGQCESEAPDTQGSESAVLSSFKCSFQIQRLFLDIYLKTVHSRRKQVIFLMTRCSETAQYTKPLPISLLHKRKMGCFQGCTTDFFLFFFFRFLCKSWRERPLNNLPNEMLFHIVRDGWKVQMFYHHLTRSKPLSSSSRPPYLECTTVFETMTDFCGTKSFPETLSLTARHCFPSGMSVLNFLMFGLQFLFCSIWRG